MNKTENQVIPLSMYIYDQDGNIQYTDEANRKFKNITLEDYERIKNTLNGIEIIGERDSQIFLIERKEIWSNLYNELLAHINTLQSLYPYCDFKKAREKAKDVVFRIRIEMDKNMNVIDDQSTSHKFPFIALHMEYKNLNNETDVKGYAGIRHEFTHFCCDGLNLPFLLNEGITQEITNDCLKFEKRDKELINYSLNTYKVNTELAQIYMNLFAKENIVDAYFRQDSSSIKEMMIELASQIPQYSKIANEKFVDTLNYELNLLLIYAQSYVNFSDKRFEKLDDFKCFLSFLEFASYIYSKEPNYIISESYKEKVNDIYASFNEYFEQRAINKNTILR